MTSSVLLTGATSGLGFETSAQLAAAGEHVIMGCRDVQRGETAASRIRQRVPGASLEVLELDLAALDSIRFAAATLIKTAADRPPLHHLVCNAGIQVVNGVRRSQDGYELTFATNHLGHFLLTRLLLDHVAEPGRILLVSSAVHYGPAKSMGFPAPRWEDPRALADPAKSALDGSAKSGRIRYSVSKLANLYMCYELARRVEDRALTVNSFDPGLMPATGLARDWPAAVRRVYGKLTPLLVRFPGAATVPESAGNLCLLTTSPGMADVTGAYFAGRQRQKSSAESYDQERAAELWKISEELVAAP